MSFQPPDVYGTSGGVDLFNKPQSPPDIRNAEGRVYLAFLRVNGVIVEKFREHVEDVVRVLGLSGETLVGIIVRDDGTVIDDNARDIDVTGALQAVLDGIITHKVNISISNVSITTDMLAGLSVTLEKHAANSVNASKIVDSSLTVSRFNSADITEAIEDIIGVTLVDSTSVDVTYNDAGNTYSASILLGGGGASNLPSRSDHSHAYVITERTNTALCPANTVCTVTQACNAGEQVVHGGMDFQTSNVKTLGSRMSGNSWQTFVHNTAALVGNNVTVRAICKTIPV